MKEEDDGHGPGHGCNYNQCGNPEAEAACPFIRDNKVRSEVKLLPDCNHEWRQYWITETNTSSGDPVALPDGYYCVRCLTIRETDFAE
jgi:hypothetical protein